VADSLRKQQRIPSAVWLGSQQVPPESYLNTLAEVVLLLLEGKEPPRQVHVKPARLAAGEYASADDAKLWVWVIFPPGFRAPAMMQLARLQAWTIKPAVLGE
jgi:dipeptidyl aminopeptidase/acylaminoacyl peptidase